jgi:hypothetical protein
LTAYTETMRRFAAITFRPRHGPPYEVGALWQDEAGLVLLVSRAKPSEDPRDRRERRVGLLSIRSGLERIDQLPPGTGDRFVLHPAQAWPSKEPPMRFPEARG